MTDKLTIKKYLKLDDFDPLNIDIGEFKNLSNMMPKDANIDIPNAEKLTILYLRAADRFSEILSSIIIIEGKAKSNLNVIKNKLFLEAKVLGYKTIKECEAYAESHNDFILAFDKHNEVFAVRKFFESKQKWCVEAHYLMKQRLKGEYNHKNASGFSETSGVTYGEVSWKNE
jgi:hypothetical protein